MLLQDAQQLRLELERNVADLVEEERSAVGELEPADLLRDRAGERAALVAEELALEKPGGNRGAVHFDERPRLAGRQLVDRPGDELLTRSGLAANQHGRRSRADGLDLREDGLQRRRLADDLFEVVLAAQLVLEVDLLERELVAQRRDLLERERVLDRERDLTGRCREDRHVVVAERLAPQAADDDRADAVPARAHRQEARRLDAELGEDRPVAGPDSRDDVTAHAQRRSRPERRDRRICVVVHREELAFPNDLFVLERDGGDPEAVPLGVVHHEGREVVRHDAPETRRDVVEERRGVEVRDERVVDLEQNPEPVVLLPEARSASSALS